MMLPMPMPPSASPDHTSSIAADPDVARAAIPTPVAITAASATRSNPNRWVSGGAMKPARPNITVGIMATNPIVVGPKPMSAAMRVSRGTSDVTAVRRVKAKTRMAMPTMSRPAHNDPAPGPALLRGSVGSASSRMSPPFMGSGICTLT